MTSIRASTLNQETTSIISTLNELLLTTLAFKTERTSLDPISSSLFSTTRLISNDQFSIAQSEPTSKIFYF